MMSLRLHEPEMAWTNPGVLSWALWPRRQQPQTAPQQRRATPPECPRAVPPGAKRLHPGGEDVRGELSLHAVFQRVQSGQRPFQADGAVHP